MPSPVVIATAAVPLLRQAIHAIEARADWSPEQKKWIPWVCVALGTLAALACAVAGMPVVDAAIIGGSGPGAVVLNELMGVTKKTPPPAALLLLALSLAACAPATANEAAGVAAFAFGMLGCAIILLQSLGRYRARRRADASDLREIEARGEVYAVPMISAAEADATARAIERQRRHGIRVPTALALALLSASMALPVGGCLPGILGAKQSLSNVERVSASGVRTFAAFDEQHQVEIAEAARARGDIEGGRAELAAYRAVRAKILIAEASLAASITACHAAIAIVESGGKANWGALLGDVLQASDELRRAIAALSPAAPPISRIDVQRLPLNDARADHLLGGLS